MNTEFDVRNRPDSHTTRESAFRISVRSASDPGEIDRVVAY